MSRKDQWELSPFVDGLAEEIHVKRTTGLFGRSEFELTRRRIPVQPSGPMVDALEGVVHHVARQLAQFRADVQLDRARLLEAVREEVAELRRRPALTSPRWALADEMAVILAKYGNVRNLALKAGFYQELAALVAEDVVRKQQALPAHRGTQ